jgi:hypothetical protein
LPPSSSYKNMSTNTSNSNTENSRNILPMSELSQANNQGPMNFNSPSMPPLDDLPPMGSMPPLDNSASMVPKKKFLGIR